MNIQNRISLCDGWEFSPVWSDAFLRGEGEAEEVRLPHQIQDLPMHYASPTQYERICGYRKMLRIPEQAVGKRVFLQFDGAAHIASVFLNGKELCKHYGGYTAFRVELTGLLKPGEEGLLAVRLDSTENPEIPPFGYVIDYLTYSGLYREVWLELRTKDYIKDVYVTTPELEVAEVYVTIEGKPHPVRVSIWDGDTCLASTEGPVRFRMRIPGVDAWSPENPALYECRAELLDCESDPNYNIVLDTVSVSFGFRTLVFDQNQFYLNGEPLFLRGLNRHQSFPYIGYAAPAHLQREDARILKEELACNAVRTSHYPQSQHFLDACDELGLLVFTEFPGWQHVGGAKWKEHALNTLAELPGIIRIRTFTK